MASSKIFSRRNGGGSTIKIPLKGKTNFDPAAFLAKAGLGRTIVHLQKKRAVFSQGDPSDAVFYIQSGRIRLSVISRAGKVGRGVRCCCSVDSPGQCGCTYRLRATQDR